MSTRLIKRVCLLPLLFNLNISLFFSLITHVVEDTPLFRALTETKGAPKAVETLLSCGADVYAETR